jgi:hypothetical protein
MSQTIFHDFQREHGTLVKMNFTESANSITLPNLVVKAAFQVLHRFLHRICQEHHHCMLLEDQRLGDVLCQELVYLVLSWWDAASLICTLPLETALDVQLSEITNSFLSVLQNRICTLLLGEKQMPISFTDMVS